MANKSKWAIGAWTPDRCRLWQQMGPNMRKRLEAWVMAEHLQNRCHKTELPIITDGDAQNDGRILMATTPLGACCEECARLGEVK